MTHPQPIPPALQPLQGAPRWVVWRRERVSGRMTKVPYLSRGTKAKTNDPSTWRTFDKLPPRTGFDGAGLVLGDGLQGVDLDVCIDADGVLEPWAGAIVERLDSYTEVSPSGRGLKAFFYGPAGESAKVSFGDAVDIGEEEPKRRELAYFTGARYFTVTGRPWRDCPLRTISADDAAWLRERVEQLRPAPSPASGGAQSSVPPRDDFRRINAMALAALDAWVPALFPTARRTAQGYRVPQADLGRDLEEDLSVTPHGIKDWGVHDLGDAREGGRTPIDLVIEWRGGAPRDALHWLAGRLGVQLQDPPKPRIGPPPAQEPHDEGEQSDEAPPLFHVVDMTALERDDIDEAVDWVWRDYVPRKHVTLLGGHGGQGKSSFALQLAACAAAGAACLGRATDAEKVLFFSGEDDAELVMKRLRRICRRLALDVRKVTRNLQVLDASDLSPVLFAEVRELGVRRGTTTATYAALAEHIEQHRYGLIFIDNASDVFDADEINRPLVREFIRTLKRLAAAHGGAVVLLAHVDKLTSRAGKMASAESYSGSTAWHNSVRSRLFLLETEPGAFELQHQKCNVAPKQPPLALLWPTDDVLHPAAPAGGMVAHLQEKNETRALLALIQEFYTRGEWVATGATGQRCATALLSAERTYPKHLSPRDVAARLRDAERTGLIQQETYKKADRKDATRWKVTEKGAEFVNAAVAAVARQFGTAATTAGGKNCAAVLPLGGTGEVPHTTAAAAKADEGAPF